MKYLIYVLILFLIIAGVIYFQKINSLDRDNNLPELLFDDSEVITSQGEINNIEIKYIVQKRFFNKPVQEVIGFSSQIDSLDISQSGGVYSIDATIKTKSFHTDNQARDKDLPKYVGDEILISAKDVDLTKIESQIPVLISLKGEQRSIVFDIQVLELNDKYNISGKGSFQLSDFNLSAPSLAKVYEVDDNINIEFDVDLLK